MATNISPETIKQNYDQLMTLIDTTFPDRPELRKVYEAYKERLHFSPASAFDYFHNAVPGGYCDHVLRVVTFSKYYYKMFEKLGLDVSNFKLSELIFAAINHDLGKLGFPGDGYDGYKVNESEWHRKNQGRLYNVTDATPYSTVPDLGLYILQKYGVDMSWNEYHAIKIHDGMYDDSNKPYLTSFSAGNKLRSNISMILHHADMAASRFEWERWNKNTSATSSKNVIDTSPIVEWSTDTAPETNLINTGFVEAPKKKTAADEFTDIFEK